MADIDLGAKVTHSRDTKLDMSQWCCEREVDAFCSVKYYTLHLSLHFKPPPPIPHINPTVINSSRAENKIFKHFTIVIKYIFRTLGFL